MITRGPYYDYPWAVLWRWRNNGGIWTLAETAFTSCPAKSIV